MPTTILLQHVEQGLGPSEIGRGEALAEPAVNERKQIAGFGTPALVMAKPGDAHGSAQLPEFRPLLSGDAQGFTVELLSGLGMVLSQQELTFVPEKLCFEPVRSRPLDDLHCIV